MLVTTIFSFSHNVTDRFLSQSPKQSRLCGKEVKAFAATKFLQLRSYHCGHRCVSWLSHTSTDTTFFPKPLTTSLTCIISERRKTTKKEALVFNCLQYKFFENTVSAVQVFCKHRRKRRNCS